MKQKKKRSLSKHQSRGREKDKRSKPRGKPVSVKPKRRQVTSKKLDRGKVQKVKKETNKKLIVPAKRYYINISGKKVCLDNEIIKKYNLKAGDFLPFSRHKVLIEK